jgi:hypothetical protein
MSWLRRFSVLGLALLLATGVSCTSDTALTEAPVTTTAEEPSQILGSALDGLGDIVGEVENTTEGLVGGGLGGIESTLEGTTGGLTGGVGETVGGVVGGVLAVTDLLVCKEQPYKITRKIIGQKGGEIQVGSHILTIPRGALREPELITAEQMPGTTNSVRFSPEKLRFKRSAELTMSYKNCTVVLLPKKIVYTDENLTILEVLKSLDLFQKKTVSAPIDHFSRYALAY